MAKCPQQRDDGDAGAGCPVQHQLSLNNMMPSDLSQSDSPASAALPDLRVSSSIPRSGLEGDAGGGGGDARPSAANGTWLYPSPRMFYNAMRRKGHGARPEDMEVIVTIHNMVNEQTWQAVLRWESYYHPEGQPKLGRFLGRPDDLSPRAWLRTYILGYRRPFDRHDWFVERADGSTARYVIDFYSGKAAEPAPGCGDVPVPPSFHIDARPAIDSWQALYERMHYSVQGALHRLSQALRAAPWGGGTTQQR